MSKFEDLYKNRGFSSCRSGAFRCVLVQSQGKKTSAIILEKHLLVVINLGRVIRAFAKNLKSTVRKIFTYGKHSKQFPVFPGADILANSSQGQRVQCLSNYKKASVSMLNVKVHDSTI